MSEYSNVDRPFLDKLRRLGWEVIDHGTGFIPQDPAVFKPGLKPTNHCHFLPFARKGTALPSTIGSEIPS